MIGFCIGLVIGALIAGIIFYGLAKKLTDRMRYYRFAYSAVMKTLNAVMERVNDLENGLVDGEDCVETSNLH